MVTTKFGKTNPVELVSICLNHHLGTFMKLLTLSLLSLAFAVGSTQAVQVSSPDIKEGHFMAKTFEFAGFGCNGANKSPALNWSD